MLGFWLLRGDTKAAFIELTSDKGDDNDDYWHINNVTGTGAQDSHIYIPDFNSGSWDNEFVFINNGQLQAEGGFSHTGVDYAEFFEWKTELANAAAAKSLYGETVVLDDGKIRLAQAGEESKVLGVVRPPDVSGSVGGSEFFKWKNKYLKDVWGETIQEEYTQCKWFEYDADGNEYIDYIGSWGK